MGFSTETCILVHILPHIYAKIKKFSFVIIIPDCAMASKWYTIVRQVGLNLAQEGFVFFLIFFRTGNYESDVLFFFVVVVFCVCSSKVFVINFQKKQYCVTVISISYSGVGSQEPLIIFMPSVSIFQKIVHESSPMFIYNKQNKLYMIARRYGIYLLVFKSISHLFTALTCLISI